MVEEREELQNSNPAAEEELSTGRKVVAFLLTLLLLPFLFAGACFGILLNYGRDPATLIFVGLAILILLAYVAVLTRNPGVRWGLIVVGVTSAAILLLIFGR